MEHITESPSQRATHKASNRGEQEAQQGVLHREPSTGSPAQRV